MSGHAARRLLRAGLGAAAAGAALTLLVPQLSTAWPALHALPLLTVLTALACQLVALALRAEVWRSCLAAVVDTHIPRRGLHLACGAMFVCGLVLRPAGQAARIAVLRRQDPAAVPPAMQMLVADAPAFVIEATLLLSIALVALVAGGSDWWLPAAGLAACAACLWGLRHIASRGRPGHGLAVLRDRGRMCRLTGQLGALLALQLIRNALLLEALGLTGGVRRAALLLVAMSVAGALPSGALGAPAGAFAVVASGGGAAAASLAVLAVVMAAAVLYASAAGVLHLGAVGRLR